MVTDKILTLDLIKINVYAYFYHGYKSEHISAGGLDEISSLWLSGHFRNVTGIENVSQQF